MRRRAVSQRFQSTLPARGATFLTALSVKPAFDFNPRSPHGERRAPKALPDAGAGISIHAPRTGSDRVMWRLSHCHSNFNPRSPHGERPLRRASSARSRSFQSTLPARGATGGGHPERGVRHLFQSTLPARGATFLCYYFIRRKGISIHAPRTGSDAERETAVATGVDFNPRSPHGERRHFSTLHQ